MRIRQDIATELGAYVQERFPSMLNGVYPYIIAICHYVGVDVTTGLHGSTASGFALVTSDVNLYLHVPEPASSGHQVCKCVVFNVE